MAAPPPSYEDVIKKSETDPSAPPPPAPYPPAQYPPAQYPPTPYPPAMAGGPPQPAYPAGVAPPPQPYPQPGYPPAGIATAGPMYPQQHGQPVQVYQASNQPGTYTYNTVTVANTGNNAYNTTPLAYGNTTNIGNSDLQRKRCIMICVVAVIFLSIPIISFLTIMRR